MGRQWHWLWLVKEDGVEVFRSWHRRVAAGEAERRRESWGFELRQPEITVEMALVLRGEMRLSA